MTAQVYRHAKEEPEAMGKEVWLAGTDKMTGAIKKAYDNPSRKLPFSAGFAHDLSLIYGPNLPKISASPGVNVLGEWARYEPVFAASLNVQYLRWGTLNCQIASRAVHTAVVEGCDYVWTRYLAQKTPLFFGEPGRIPNLPRGGPEACYALGRPTDAEARLILTQDYQSPIHKWPVGKRPSQETATDSIKEGFFSYLKRSDRRKSYWTQE